MLRFALRRLATSALLLFAVLTATFFLIHLAPGDPTDLVLADARIPPSYRATLTERYGLDRPLPERYLRWLRAVVVDGDWGRSFQDDRPATDALARALPKTGLLVLGTVIVQYGLGLLLGVLAAIRRGWADRAIRATTILLWSLPGFWLALLAIELFSVRLGWVPSSGMRSLDADTLPPLARALDLLHHLALPALVLGLLGSAEVVRLVRNRLLDVLGQDYVRAARARGLGPARVLFGHALPNALGPLIQHLGVVLPALLNGALIVEVIFGWPGVGRVTFLALQGRDYPVILAGTALSGALVVLGTLLADVLHAWLDPRVREATDAP